MTKSVKIGIAALAVVVAASVAALLLAPKGEGAVAVIKQDGVRWVQRLSHLSIPSLSTTSD